MNTAMLDLPESPFVDELREQLDRAFGSPTTLWLVSEHCDDHHLLRDLRDRALVVPRLERLELLCQPIADDGPSTLEFATRTLGVTDIVVCGHPNLLGADSASGRDVSDAPRPTDLLQRVRSRQEQLATAKRATVELWSRLLRTSFATKAVASGQIRFHCLFHVDENGSFLLFDERLERFVVVDEPTAVVA